MTNRWFVGGNQTTILQLLKGLCIRLRILLILRVVSPRQPDFQVGRIIVSESVHANLIDNQFHIENYRMKIYIEYNKLDFSGIGLTLIGLYPYSNRT